MSNIVTENIGGIEEPTWGKAFKDAFSASFGDMFSGANMGKAAVGGIGALGSLASGFISNGFSTTGGQVLGAAGDVAMAFNPIVGGALKLAEGITNRAFGTKWNDKAVAEAKGNIRGLNTFVSNASNYDALSSDFNSIEKMKKTYKASDLGEDGWLVNKTGALADELNRKSRNAFSNAMRGAAHTADNIASTTLANLERNYSAFGGPLFAYGGQTHGSDFTNGLMFINNGGTHESNPYEGIPISMDKEGNPNLVEEGEVIWNDYVFSNRLKVPKSIQKKYKLGKKEMTFANAVDKLSKESEERPNDPISMRGLENILMNMAIEQETLKSKKQYKETGNKFNTGGPFGDSTSPFTEDGEYISGWVDRVNNLTLADYNRYLKSKNSTEITPYEFRSLQSGALDGKKGEKHNKMWEALNWIHENPSNPSKGSPKNLPTWFRYAPVLGHSLSLAHNLFQKPNYENADAIIKASKNLYSNPIKFNPIGDYMAYTPFDTEYHANQLRSVAGATRRNIMNTSGGNRATAMAGILAADNNTMNQMGDLYRKAAEYNLEQRHKVAEFNRATNKFNSEGAFRADQANQVARQAGLDGIIKGYTMKESINALKNQAISDSLSGLFQSIGDIGYDNLVQNQINWRTSGGVDGPGTESYMREVKGKNNKGNKDPNKDNGKGKGGKG